MSDDWGLVMPFVVCASQGGPYHDDSFVGGYECGFIDALLTSGQKRVQRLAHRASLPQIDLIAMKHNCSIHVQDDGEWATVTLTKV